MRILVVHETEYQDKVVFEFQILPELLASSGHDVTVVDYPQYWKKTNWIDFGSLRTRIFTNVRKSHKKKGVTLVRPGIIKIPGISRVSGFFTHFAEIGRLIRTNKIDKIILYSVPTNGLSTIFWARYYRIPILFRLLDVLHEIVPHVLLKYPTLILEMMVYRLVDRMSTTTPRMVRYAKKMTHNNLKIDYHDSGADADIFKPQSKDAQLMKHIGLTSKNSVMLFAGTLYRFSGLLELIRAMPNYVQRNDMARLVIVGHGEQEEELRLLVKDLQLSDFVKLVGFVPYEELGKYVNLADVGVNMFIKGPITNDIFPGKVYQYLACGKPVIATPLPGMTDVYSADRIDHGIYYADNAVACWDTFGELISRKTILTPLSPSLQDVAHEIEDILEKL